jgi:membrane protein YqaA with SNARE-associated domain
VTSLAGLSFPAAASWCLGVTTVSAIVPWINAEVVVLSLPAVAGSTPALVALVGVATLGQMAGKSVIYWAARRGVRAPSAAMQARLDDWRLRLEHRRYALPALVFVSSVVGIPPFYLMTLLAGALGMSFPLFLVAGTAGRLVRFGSLAAGAATVMARI